MLVRSTIAEETYRAYHVKVKYCPPPDLEKYVGDTHDNGCVSNLDAFTVWAAEGKELKVKLFRTEHIEISWMASSRYAPAVYSKGCLDKYFPPVESGYYLMDFPINMQPEAAGDREVIEENLQIEVVKEFSVSRSQMAQTASLLNQQPIGYEPIPSGTVDDLPEKQCAKLPG